MNRPPLLGRLAGALAASTGLRVDARPALERRFRRTLDAHGIHDPAALDEALHREGGVRDALIESTVVTESYFLRDRGQYAFLGRLLPRLVAEAAGRHVRVLSAGCAGGEEAYTLAILAAETGVADRVRIDAVDLSNEALVRARVGVYSDWSLRSLDPAERRRWFETTPAGYRLRDGFRTVSFARENLADDGAPAAGDPWRRYDLILCRHVLLHLTPSGIERVSAGLARRLAPGGWLLTATVDPPPDGHGLRAAPEVVGAFRRATESDEPDPEVAGGVHGVGEPGEPVPARPMAGTEACGLPTGGSRPPHSPSSPHPPPSRRALAPARPRRSGERVVRAPASRGREVTLSGPLDGPGEVLERVQELRCDGQLVAAEQLARETTTAQPEDVALHLVHAAVLLDLARAREAARAARRAVYLRPGLAMGHLQLGIALAADDRERSRVAFRTARRLLEASDPEGVVPLADGEVAGRLVTLAVQHERLLTGTSA